ncbi:4-hydroxy-tetrahydrodipicolinate synthase [Ochrobactrum daejeonense]|uniref:4-hydroxy-tetrahydrodipicolinate synthase n=1 Tax=Brucella daejeonensis TaxID=659015 RepID=A0A7W9AV90_9HYPH|nr:4-hydroxy-tetrahydrodipicolinate synthase [Brucella daejeonensis]MBB5701229.1 4-hydroxy-tetrahydrodipicolinate synthase [Brucella daejeonensis]
MIQTEALKSRLHGVITALVTPFRNGNVDFPALDNLIEWQLSEGIDGFVVCGTTGEAPTLCKEERIAIIRRAVEVVGGRVPVIAGTGTNDTRSTVAFTAEAASLGIDGVLIVTPYYNRPTQEGIFRHFEAVAENVETPIIIYNVPSRTGGDLGLPTLRRLAGLRGVVGLKDATGDLSRPLGVTNLLGDGFLQFSGHDATALGFCQAGGRGTISVISNVAPGLCAQMHKACFEGDIRQAQSIDRQLRPLFAALERETNPGPAKYGLHLLQRASPEVRLPLVEVMPETASALRDAFQEIAGKEAGDDIAIQPVV